MHPKSYVVQYTAFVRGFLNPTRPLTVVFDFSNGPTELIVPEIVRGIPEIHPFFVDSKLSGNFPAHGPNPLAPKAVLHLHREVERHRADLGLIFDADGDRVFVADHRGRWVPPYVIAHLLARHETPPFLFEPRTYFSLEKAGVLDRSTTELTRVGTYFIKQRMRERRAGFAGEYSGHYFFRDFFGADSGILAAVKVLNAVTRLPYPLADFYDLFPHAVFGRELNLVTSDANAVIAAVRLHFQSERHRTYRIDTVVLDFGNWFLNIRPSNTEPLVRLFLGSRDSALLTKQFRNIEQLLTTERHLGSVSATPTAA